MYNAAENANQTERSMNATRQAQEYGVPVGSGTLGRILDSNACPLDNGPHAFESRAKQMKGGAAARAGTAPREFFRIGIKPFDLFAPVPRNGIVSLIASWGVGKIVLLHELIRTMKVVYGGRSVVVTVEGGPRELADIDSSYRESGVFDSMTVILVNRGSSREERRNAVLNGLTVARHAAEVEGCNVLFAVDQLALDEETVALIASQPECDDASVLTVISGYHFDEANPDERPVAVPADVAIVFSTDLARRGLYPAIDPFESTSTILTEEIVGAEHVRIAAQVRALLKSARELRCRAGFDDATVDPDEHVLLERATRAERFLTQPFYVAQLANGIPGEQVDVKDSLRQFAALLDGEYDHLPVEAFSYVGTIS